jgi:hypothetical protein
VTFSDAPDKQCHHSAEVVADAPVAACYALWSEWSTLLEFLDLVGQVMRVCAVGAARCCVSVLLCACRRDTRRRGCPAPPTPHPPGACPAPHARDTPRCSANHARHTRLCRCITPQIGLDGDNPNLALFQCFYRYRECGVCECVVSWAVLRPPSVHTHTQVWQQPSWAG